MRLKLFSRCVKSDTGLALTGSGVRILFEAGGFNRTWPRAGAKASWNDHSRYARSSERRKMGIKLSFWRIQITVKLSFRRKVRVKKLSRS